LTMTTAYEPGTRVMTRRAFEFVLGLELERALRSQEFLTFVSVKTVREWQGVTFNADDGTLHEIGGLMCGVVRGSDFVGRCGAGTLAVVLVRSCFEHSSRVIDRLVERIEQYQFVSDIRVAIGAACYPVHAVDLVSLERTAAAHPIVSVRRSPAPAQDDATAAL
jgi:GGDEF domain-containing protein